MLYIFLHIIIKFIVILHYVSSENSPKHNGKLPEEAMQMCIDSFDIHKDKIIRTQDSLALGAKYIMEIELDDKQECLKYCCKTDDCDVFIFEEKKQGSCYLFHCGPPHDFKCKFTSHANYTSAVRLEEQMRHSQQEHELKSLRKMAEHVSIDYSYTEAPPIVVPEITDTPKIVTSTTPIPIKIPCTRNQYECRASGDCIAIYNVCDGIPQCTDGSDEASDLGCPTEKATPRPLAPHVPMILPVEERLKYPTPIQHHNNYPMIYGKPNPPLEPWQIPQTIHQSVSQPQNVQYPPQQVASMPLGNYASQGYVNGWEYRQMYDQNKEPYPINPIHSKIDLPHYENEQPHIFNHKRPGVVKENVGETAVNYLEPERGYGSYYSNQNRENWPIGQRQEIELQQKPQILPTIPPVILPKEVQFPPVIHEHPIANSNELASDKNKAVAEREPSVKSSSTIKKELETQKNIHLSKQSTSMAMEKTPPLKKDNYVNKSLENHEKSGNEHSEVRIHHFTAEHLQQNNPKDYNEILRPRGAVISLALGLSATVIMVALITCRLRVVRRRGRRHGSYAHDADYLVNGMYL